MRASLRARTAIRASALAFAFALTLQHAYAANAETRARTPTVSPSLAGLRFLVGTWSSHDGTVAETGGTSHGTSTIGPEVAGSVLLRRDHVELFGADGKATGTFDILMTIYAEGDAIRADYEDGAHVIHYTSASVVAGRSVAFSSASSATAPTFRLTYASTDPTTLAVRFEMEPPGASAFRPIASGSLTRVTP